MLPNIPSFVPMRSFALLVVAAHGAKVQLHQQALSSKMADLADSAKVLLKQVAYKPGDVNEQQQLSTSRKNDVVAFTERSANETKEVLKAIQHEHDADVLLLAIEFQKIADLLTWRTTRGREIAVERALEITLKNAHFDCRVVQKGNCTNEKYTNEQLRIHEENMSDYEVQTQQLETDIKARMCVQTDVNTWITEVVIELQGKKIEFEWYETIFWSYRETFYSLVEATRQWRPWPAWQHGNESETNVTKVQCNLDQDALETQSCKRAKAVLDLNAWFETEWTRLVLNYNTAVTQILAKAENRKHEWYGTKVVECLLIRIHEHHESNEPCDEDFANNQTTDEIDACHNDQQDTFHLDIVPEPVPTKPAPYCLDPHPCTANWMIEENEIDFAFGYRHTDQDDDGVDDLCRTLKGCTACTQFTAEDVPNHSTCEELPQVPLGQLLQEDCSGADCKPVAVVEH